MIRVSLSSEFSEILMPSEVKLTQLYQYPVITMKLVLATDIIFGLRKINLSNILSPNSAIPDMAEVFLSSRIKLIQ